MEIQLLEALQSQNRVIKSRENGIEPRQKRKKYKPEKLVPGSLHGSDPRLEDFKVLEKFLGRDIEDFYDAIAAAEKTATGNFQRANLCGIHARR